MHISDSTALVSGANRGIGRALVEALVTAGAARVYAVARNVDALAPVVALAPARVTALRADVTDENEVAALAHAAGDVTLLINNAGVLDFGNILDSPRATIERNFATNFYGTLAMCRSFAPVIAGNGGGTIVNLLSVVAFANLPMLAGYSASKAAAWSLTQALRASLKPKKIAVLGVFPGPVDTDMASELAMKKASPGDVARAVLAGIEAGTEEICPDPMAVGLYAAWKENHKAVEQQFASM